MNADIIYLFIGLGLGCALGYNLKKPSTESVEEQLPKDVEKLQEELLVYKNLRESLMADVRYWRDKAKQNELQK